MFQAWTLIDCGLTGTSAGHHYWEAEALSTELARRGIALDILCHKSERAPRLAHARVEPGFPLFLYQYVSNDPVWAYTENFVLHNRSFHQALARLNPGSFQNALVLMPTMTERQLLGAIRWLAQFADGARPKSVIVLEPLYDWASDGPEAKSYRSIWAHCPPNVKRDIRLGVRLPALAEKFAALIGTAPSVLPQPIAFPGTPATPVSAGSGLVVSFLGGARRERGAHLIPEIVERCALLDVRFVIQVKAGADSGFDGSLLAALEKHPNVELHRGAMKPEDYYTALANSIVLLPYRADRYRWRSSGVYFEAKYLGAPMIVAPGIWMADEVAAAGNGIVAREESAAGFAEAIARAAREADRLRVCAGMAARDVRAHGGVGRFVDVAAALAGESGS